MSRNSGKRHPNKAQKYTRRRCNYWFYCKHGYSYKEPAKNTSSFEDDFAKLREQILGIGAKK